jgi:hypothetical protein
VAHTRVRNPDKDFALLWRLDVDFNDLQRLACLKGNCGFGFHEFS